MSGITDEEYHHLLVRQNRENIELAAVRAFEQQLELPVVLLLDLADPVAQAIARTAGRQPVIDAQVAEFERRGVVPVLTWHLPARAALDLLRRYYPDTEEFAPLGDSNSFYTVVLARGAKTWGALHLPSTKGDADREPGHGV